MSIFFTPQSDQDFPKLTLQDLHDTAAQSGVSISVQDETAYLSCLQAADIAIWHINSLPSYTPPSLIPKNVPSYERPGPADNPLNAWSHKIVDDVPANDGPLRGRAVISKDNISVAGLPLTCGTFPQLLAADGQYPISKINASVVTRIREAGGRIAGTASCENYSLCALSYSSALGFIDNPWGHGRATGGSSSGCAALLAANAIKKWRARNGITSEEPVYDGVDLAIGGDQGGSIRMPAAFSGVYGLKPTHGLVPYTGIALLHPLIDHCGPMANSVTDIALLLTALAGYDGIDPRMSPETPLRANVEDYSATLQARIDARKAAGTWTSDQAGVGLRVGMLTEGWMSPVLDPEVGAVVREAAARFEHLGATVKDVSIPLHREGPIIWTASTRGAMGSYAFANAPPPLHGYALPDLRPPAPTQEWFDLMSRHNPAGANVLLTGTYLAKHYPPSTAAKAIAHVLELRAAYDAALEQHDVLVMPLNLTVAPVSPPESLSVMERIQVAAGNTANTCPFNASGHPALSMPAGWASAPGANMREKMPVAMQIVGKRWRESDVLFAAAVWEVDGLGLDNM